jgi:hypothetical protein
MDQVGTIRELAMTTKELCDALRHTHPSRTMCKQAADEIERLAALAQSDTEPVRAFAKAVLHGDDEHKAWLLEAAEAFIDGKPLPAPRGRGAQSDTEPVRIVHDDAFGWGVLLNGKPVKCLFNSKEKTVAWLAAAIAHPDDIRD